MFIPNHVLGRILAQDRQHNAHPLPVTFFRSGTLFFQDVGHAILIDRIKLVNRQQRTSFVIQHILSYVLIDPFGIKFLRRSLLDDVRLNHRFLHEVFIQCRIPQLGDNLDELRVAMLGALGPMPGVASGLKD